MEYNLLHTCLRVMDLEKAVTFYTEALGFRETHRNDVPDGEFTLVFMTDKAGTHQIELTYNYHPEKPYVIGDGFSHIAVGTADLEGSHKRHQEMGYKVGKLRSLRDGPPGYYFMYDPDGYEVEVCRRK